ncbi:hypothetical protein QWZ08_20695 [Ferruginibacter paludis]|uniref:hypothetical protein n=1 Tax=Ferruginibacter paludis TaxID=1310417 RepID=UPI0025B36E94|nr:hypothetical protein [Ferruginibacter paludis]MDN3658083.1 hypothetical protein [Ferruginibacter paludis]
MRYLLLLLITTTLVNATSCRETKKSATATAVTDSSKTGEMKIMIPNTYCYSNPGGKDSVYLKLEKFPNVVTGKLMYKLYEKDSNTGDIDGVLHGDTLIADYKFLSEGVTSVRQIIFLIKNDTAREGYGEMEERNGKMVFKNLQETDFTKSVLLNKTECSIQ